MFNIPNSADALNVLQAQPDSRDFSAMIAAAFSGTGVVGSGCAVTAQAAPNMTVAVAAGQVAVAGTIASVTGGNVTITAANASNPRFDLICVDNTGAKSAVAGTPAAAPVFPDPAGRVVLAAVLVSANASSINNSMIVDKRLNAVVVAATEATGVIKGFGGTVAPGGYLLCDGSAVSRTTYAALFSVISTLNGVGDGSTTFNLPDGAGRTMVGLGSHADVNLISKTEGLPALSRSPIHNSTNGVTAGHNLSLPDHGHNVYDPTHTHNMYQWNGGNPGPYLTPAANNNAKTDLSVQQGNTIVPSGTGIQVQGAQSFPGINGAVQIGGTIGPGGTRPTDRVPFFVGNWIIKT